jgi:hypothetical protein
VSVTVQVTTGHITEGRRGRCGECPVALAVADALPGAALVCACPAWITFILAGREVRVPAPPHVAAFIRAFDSRRYAGPFDFTLTIPEARQLPAPPTGPLG